LPPTRFFQDLKNDEFTEEDYVIDEYESILHACISINIPHRPLLITLIGGFLVNSYKRRYSYEPSWRTF